MYRILYNICEVIDMDRREKIIQIIQRNEKPISASTLAKQLGVSRQIIVGDVALIRASGTHIIATPRGYVLDDNKEDTLYTIAVHHQKKDLIDVLHRVTMCICVWVCSHGCSAPGGQKRGKDFL